MPRTDQDARGNILKILKERRGSYGVARVRCALVRDRGVWKNSLTRIELLHKDEKVDDRIFDYGNVVLGDVGLSIDEFASLMDKLICDNELAIKNCPSVKVRVDFRTFPELDFVSSDHKCFKHNWPANVFHFSYANEFRAAFPYGPLVALNCPLFPGLHEVRRIWTEIDTTKCSALFNSIIVLLPKYEARIKKLKLGSDELTIEILPKELKCNNILGKAYFGEFGGEAKAEQKDIDFGNESMRKVTVNLIPDHIYICILSKTTGELLDYRNIYLSWPSPSEDIEFEMTPTSVLEIIRRGENERAEFKSKIDTRELVETVVSFSNTEGGVILVGVDDNGNVRGCYDKKAEERIHNILRSHCEPSVDPTIETEIVEGKPVVVVQVHEGENKPYMFRDRGVYVRRGSTDRIAKRDELDEMYEEIAFL